MRKTYMMLVAMVLSVLGATTVTAQKIYKAELDVSMFKAWDGYGADANVVEDPQPIDVSETNPNGSPFGCENNLYKQLEGGNVVFGNTNVYYLWYADITGTKTFNAEGTPGLQLRVLMNRPEPVEGGDAHGGQSVERMLTIGENGVGSLDVSDMEYVHLNCIKVNWGGKGIVRNFYIEGTMKPVTGILSMINNGDAEGDDLASFPVSFDGPNNGGTANDLPEIVAGGVGGSKCFKVTAHTEPTETWHTQFYIKADDVMPKGSKWKLVMSVKADRDARITTSAQAQPRTWKGNMGIDEFGVSTEWKKFEWSGEIGVDDFQSIAFDLNNGDEEVPNTKGDGTVKISRGITYYFDNIEFGYDLGGTNPLNSMACTYGADVVCINFSDMTNMKELVKNTTDGKTLIFPNECATLTINGEEAELVSVEGRPDGNLYFFMLTEEAYENDEVVVAFKNPADADHHLVYNIGKWEGMDVPDFSGVTGEFSAELSIGNIWSYFYDAPKLKSAEPEAGSFNLPGDMKEFKVTFNQDVEVKSVVAKLDGELLTPSGDAEHSPVVILTRSGSNELSGEKTLVISQVKGEKSGIEGEDEYIEVKYSFGPITVDPNDQEEIALEDYFATTDEGKIPEGYIVNFNGEERTSETGSYSSGPRMFNFGEGGDFTKGLYYREGYVQYGTVEGHQLALKAGKPYTVSFTSAMWKDNGAQQTFQILNEDEEELLSKTIDNTPNVNGSQSAVNGATQTAIEFIPEKDGNYILKWSVPGNNEVLIANVAVKYEPNVLGLKETKLIAEALKKAKETLEANGDERYAGIAVTTLDNLVKEYDGKTMTAPSAYAKATNDLNAGTKAVTDHVTLCNEYDKLPEQAYNLYVENREKKFNVTEYFANLKTAVQKYCVTGTEEQIGEDGEPVNVEVMESFKLFYDDAELNAAKDELTTVIDMASKMFTEGKSHNWYGGGDRTSGYAALHERLRRGVELLNSLGVDESEEVIAAANAELGDNDEIAEAIIKRANQIILADLASGESKLFEMNVDDETGVESSASYDLSVFAKNPNIYSPANSTELPGWVNARGNAGVFPGWGAEHTANTPYPEDCQIHAGWHPSNLPMVEQTIENLPAGIYTIKIDGSDNNSEVSDGTYGYVKLSDTPALDDVDAFDPEYHFAGYVHCSGDIEGIEVVDGKLTVGFSYGGGSQAFINDIEVWMTAPIAGHDYGKDYQEVLASVETAKTAKVRGLELYDLNGRRITTARKGLVIVKKYMSDGTVKTEKVVK